MVPPHPKVSTLIERDEKKKQKETKNRRPMFKYCTHSEHESYVIFTNSRICQGEYY